MGIPFFEVFYDFFGISPSEEIGLISITEKNS